MRSLSFVFSYQKNTSDPLIIPLQGRFVHGFKFADCSSLQRPVRCDPPPQCGPFVQVGGNASGSGGLFFVKILLDFMRKSVLKVVPRSKSGIVPRLSLLGAGRLGFWGVGKGGTIR